MARTPPVESTVEPHMALSSRSREQAPSVRRDTRQGLRRAPKASGPLPLAAGASLSDMSLAAPGALVLGRLANLIARYAPRDGVFALRLPGTSAMRRTRTTSEPLHAALGPSLCIVAQGAKAMMLGSEVVEYDCARMLVLAVDLPVSGHVTRASPSAPYLGFRLDLVPARVAELAARVYPQGAPKTPHD